MNVALVGSYPPPHGGQAVHIRNLSRFLRAQGADVRVFNTGSRKDLREDGLVNISSSRSLLGALLAEGRSTLVHVHVSMPDDYHKLAPVWGAALAKRTPWVATIHSGHSAEQLRASPPLRRALTRTLLAGARKVICVNPAIRDELATLLGEARVVVIPPHSIEDAPSSTTTPFEQFLCNHHPVIACAGSYEAVYGFEQAVRLMPTVLEWHPKAALLLIGDTARAAWCRSLVSELNLGGAVEMCGDIPHTDCLQLFRRSALFLRPTLYDGDSLSVREALALGVPVVASTTDFRPEGVVQYRLDVPGDLAAKTLEALRHGAKAPHARAETGGNLAQVWQLYQEVLQG